MDGGGEEGHMISCVQFEDALRWVCLEDLLLLRRENGTILSCSDVETPDAAVTRRAQVESLQTRSVWRWGEETLR